MDLVRRLVRLEPGTTKNDAPRTLPLVPELFKVLSTQKAIRNAECPTCPWVFFRKGKPIRRFEGAWEKACKAAGLVNENGKPVPIFHDLRRTGVRNLVSGHKTRAVFDRYDIVSEADLQAAAVRLDEYIGQVAKMD